MLKKLWNKQIVMSKGDTWIETQPLSNLLTVAILFIISVGLFVCAFLFPIIMGVFITVGIIVFLFAIFLFKDLFTPMMR